MLLPVRSVVNLSFILSQNSALFAVQNSKTRNSYFHLLHILVNLQCHIIKFCFFHRLFIIFLIMIICGIDEAGRGPLAGPVVVASAVFSSDDRIEGVKDSKKLSSSQRVVLFEKIIYSVSEYHIEIIDPDIIDEINILKATMLGMEKCIKALNSKPHLYLIDGNYFKLNDNYQDSLNFKTVIHGDDIHYVISCASILAKVSRDRLMSELHKLYPVYGFDTNKGYGTKAHIAAIKAYGISPVHRKSFVKNFIEI